MQVLLVIFVKRIRTQIVEFTQSTTRNAYVVYIELQSQPLISRIHQRPQNRPQLQEQLTNSYNK